jgi:hypothetical protein
MTLTNQLHNSATHKPGIDPVCPVCSPLIAIIRDLERCAMQNEADGRRGSTSRFCDTDAAEARAVAAEQRRMIEILKGVLK